MIMAEKTKENKSPMGIQVFIDKNEKKLFLIMLLIMALIPSCGASQYLLIVIFKMGIYTIFALGLNIATGYTDLVSLGHAGFVAVGAYTASILSVRFGLNFFPATLIGMAAAGLTGLIIGLPTMRLSGTYLTVVTLGFGEIIKMIAINWERVTGGTLGVKDIPSPVLFGITLTMGNHGLYYLMIAMLILSTVFCVVFINSKTGRALKAIAGDELASIMMGIHTNYYKILAFVVSAAMCAMAGSLYASMMQYIDPNTFTFDVSVLIMSIVILGGMGTIRGMFLGSIILIAIPEVSRVLMSFRFVLYGVILVLMMRFRPQGILGWKTSLPYKFSKKVQAKIPEIEAGVTDNNG